MNFSLEREVDTDKLLTFIESMDLPFSPYDFQVDSFVDCIKKRNHVIISKTGSGKSLICHFLCEFFRKIDKKVLLIVPSTNLVSQMYKDFQSYGMKNMLTDVKCISAGVSKTFQQPIIISTWQSIYQLSEQDFSVFDAVICDEVHQAKATSISGILSKMKNAEYRIGTTGTLPKTNTADYFTIVAWLGENKLYKTYDELIKELDVLTPIEVKAVFVNYNEPDRVFAYRNLRRDYHAEVEFIQAHKDRNDFLVNYCRENCKENTLILFRNVEKHGKVLLDLFKQRFSDREILYIDGSVKTIDREDTRLNLEENDNIILIASYGVFSVGVNVKNIHHVIFASSTKSEIRTLQSIGRLLRKHKNKKKAVVHDIIDNFSYAKEGYSNYTMDHYKSRFKYYSENNFPIEHVDIYL